LICWCASTGRSSSARDARGADAQDRRRRAPALHHMLEDVLQQHLQCQRRHAAVECGFINVPIDSRTIAEALQHDLGIAPHQRQLVGQALLRTLRSIGGRTQQRRQPPEQRIGAVGVGVDQRRDGVQRVEEEMRLQLLRELRQPLRSVAILQDLAMRTTMDQVSATQEAGAKLAMRLHVLSVESPEHYEAAFEAAKKAGAEALIVLPSSAFNASRRQLIRLAAQHRLPTLWEHKLFTESGGLLSYGTDIPDLYRRAAVYVDRILKGAKPADMPVERATKVELVINAKTAKTLGITVAPTLLARADQDIQ